MGKFLSAALVWLLLTVGVGNAQTVGNQPNAQGPWIPTLSFLTPGDLAVTYTTQTGEYSLNGNVVTLTFNVVTSSFTYTTSTGQLVLRTLPFTPAAAANIITIGAVHWSGITAAGYTNVVAQINNNGSTALSFGKSGSAVASSNVLATDVPSGGSILLRGTIQYYLN